MLLNMTENLYNPTVHLTQTELMEKFNLAFYEGQNLSKNDVISTFEEDSSEDYFIDFLISNNENCNNDFDFNDFVKTFDENLSQTDTETGTTISSENFSNFFVTPPLSNFDNLDLEDIDLCDNISNSSFDFENLTNLDEPGEALPPINTIAKLDFNNYLRALPEDNLYVPETPRNNEFGHLIGSSHNNNNNYVEETENYDLPENQVVLTQNEALLNDDPVLSSTSLIWKRRQNLSESSNEEEATSQAPMQCQWDNCYQIYDSQSSLVKHIEKCHVEVKRGDEFTCYWMNCPRKIKPFNARYKLLIHMRVHSGEKPNKCPFEGCNKAFSRLENLKIHQRSHTGERPYLCQFPTCSKSFSNSSDRAKHQRTHFDTKPYACQVAGCTKKYTDPSSLRKHVKNHTNEEQMMVKKKSNDDAFNASYAKKFYDPNRQKAMKSEKNHFYASLDHNYSNYGAAEQKKYDSTNIRQDLKNKISEKNKLRKLGY